MADRDDVPMIWSTLPDGSKVGSTPWSVSSSVINGREVTFEGPTSICIWTESKDG